MKVKAIILGVFLLFTIFPTFVEADAYISDPSHIPLLDNFQTPEIRPGDSGAFRFTVLNRYDMDMKNITVTATIYACATPYFYREIADVDNPPKINNQGVEETFEFPSITNDTMVYVNFTLKSYSDTTQGTYFMQFQLDFDYNNTPYIMRSRGYFTDEQWDNATSGAHEDDPGAIDIDLLGVDGIIPDSSFKVWEPIPVWPLYVCIIPLAVLLCVLAVLFYAQEEYNMFPWLDQGFKYWSGKLHQSWRLLKHRFRQP